MIPRMDFGPAKPTRPLRELLSLAAPTIAQMASYTLMQFIDTWMLSTTGDLEASAAGSSGMFVWTILSFGIGIMFLVNTLCSQSMGQNQPQLAGRYFNQGLWWSAILTVPLTLLFLLLPMAFRKMGHSDALLSAERSYVMVIALTTPIKLASTAMGQFLLAIHRPNRVLYATLAGVFADVVACAILVMGVFHNKTYGTAGAAWAQNIGLAVEFAVMAIPLYFSPLRKEFGLGAPRLHPREFWTLAKFGMPAGVMLITEMLAWSLFQSWVVVGISEAAMSANVYAFRFMTVSFMPAVGMGTAVTALVGRYIGKNDLQKARHYANLGYVLTAIYMILCGAGFYLFRNNLISLFTHDQQVLAAGATMLIYVAFYQLFDAMYAIYNGALRGVGDTTLPAIVMTVLCWGLNVFAARWILQNHPQFGIHGAWGIALLYGASIGFFLMFRFTLTNWKSIIPHNEPDPASRPAT